MRQFFAFAVSAAFLAAVPGCRSGSEPEGEKSTGGAAQQATRPDSTGEDQPGVLIGREYVPPDALFVSVMFPRRTLSRPELADAPVEKVLGKLARMQDRLNPPVGMPLPIGFLRRLGVPLQEVEQVICVVAGARTHRRDRPRASRSVPSAEAKSEPAELSDDELKIPAEAEFEEAGVRDPEEDPWLYGLLIEAYVVRLAGPVPREAAIAQLPRPEEITFAGKTYFGQGKDTGAFAAYFPDERTMIVGEERVVRKMIVQKKTPSALTEALEDIDPEQDLQGIVHAEAVRRQFGEMLEADPTSKALADGAVSATISMRLDAQPSAGLVLCGKNAEWGARVEELVHKEIITTAREEVAQLEGYTEHPDRKVQEYRAAYLDLFTQGVNALEVEYLDERVAITLKDFAELADLVAWLKLLDALHSRDDDLPQPAVPQAEQDATAAAIRRLIPAAAGFPAADLHKIATSPTAPKPDDLKDKAFSVIALCYKLHPPGLYEAHAEEFSFDVSRVPPRPSELAQELSRSRNLGYVSMIHADRITDFTCEVDGETAKGSVSFKAPGLWQGKVQYVAERVEGRWRIKEFQLPIHRWRFVRTEAGPWKWFDFYGDVTDMDRWPVHPVSGKFTFQGKPLTGGMISFHHTRDMEVRGMYASIGRDGTYSTELPAGSYNVVVGRPQLPIPGEHRKRLKVEVKEGQNTFDFDLAPE